MININIELLSRVPELRASAVAQRCAHAIRASVLSQAKIIEDLLDMSRVRTGKLTLTAAPVDIVKVVDSIVDVAHADPATLDLEIVKSFQQHDLLVMADSVRVEQIVMNLVSNAIKFTSSGGRIEVRLYSEDGAARLDVIDSGQGIAKENLSKVFEMFGQPNSVTTRAKGGLGIGLALVRELVKLHEGRVEVYSEGIGRGSCFSVWLPLLEQAERMPEGGGNAASEGIDGLRILVVDDLEDAVSVMRMLLEMQGANVLPATSARMALDIASREPIDLLISDISMPDMDGYALLRELRNMPRYANMPAVAVTGLSREQDIGRALDAGFSAHVSKPLSMDRLMAILPELFRRRLSNERRMS